MVMAMAALSIIVSVFVLDLHHRDSNTPVPGWVRWLLFGRLSRCLGIPVRRREQPNQQTGIDRDDRPKCCNNDRHPCSAAGELRTTGRKPSMDVWTIPPRCGLVELERRARRQNFALAELLGKNQVRTRDDLCSCGLYQPGGFRQRFYHSKTSLTPPRSWSWS